MKGTAAKLSLAVAIGTVMGIIAHPPLSARQQPQEAPIKTTALLTTDWPEGGGKEVRVTIVEFAPGVAGERHLHHGPEFLYVLEGTLTLAAEGMPAVTYKQGEVFHQASRRIHALRNPSSTGRSKLLQFLIVDKGKSESVPMK